MIKTLGYALTIFGMAIVLIAYLFRFPFRIAMNGHYFDSWLLLKVVALILSLLGIALIVRGWGQLRLSN